MERITSWTQALVVHAPSGHSEGNSAFETGAVHASDEPDHGVGPQRVAHGDRRGAPEAGAHGLRAAADRREILLLEILCFLLLEILGCTPRAGTPGKYSFPSDRAFQTCTSERC